MREYIGANDIANLVSMMRSVHSGPVLLVEGVTDKRLYGKFVDIGRVEVVVGHSKDNVRIACRELYHKRNDRRVLGIMDADLDRLSGGEPRPPLFLTDLRDAEMMMMFSTPFDEVLWEYGEEDKMASFVKEHGSIRDAVVNSGFPIGLLMFVSKENDLGLSFRDLDYSRFISPADLSIDLRGMVEEAVYSSRNPSSNVKNIRNKLMKEMDNGHDPKDVCRGHDAVAVLLIGLKRIFGGYNSRNLGCGELGGALRLSFGLDDFMGTDLYRRTREWCSSQGMELWITGDRDPL